VYERDALFCIRLPELRVDGLIHSGIAGPKEVGFRLGDEEVSDRVIGINIGPTAPPHPDRTAEGSSRDGWGLRSTHPRWIKALNPLDNT